MPNNELKTLIVGCGNIAGVFDFDFEGLPTTHVGAFKNHGKFDVTACIDIDKKKLEEFAAHWSIKNAFSDINEVVSSGLHFDVISICSPTFSHYSDVLKVLELNPKLIFCEKPLASNYQDAVKIKNICQKSGVLLAVNHTRRWDPRIVELKKNILKGELGEIRSVVGYYNKGVLNNGSHMLDILLNIFGSLNIQKSILAFNDYYDDDPTVTALLSTNSGLPIHLVATNSSDYSLFELEIIGSKKTMTMRDGGLNWSTRTIINNPRFNGYKNLDKDKYSKGKYLEAMTIAVENIYDVITSGKELFCTGHEACEVHKICSDLSEMALLNSNNM